MRLRPYKSCDAAIIEKWIKDEDVFLKWGGNHFGSFPINGKIIDNKYTNENGDCKETDNSIRGKGYGAQMLSKGLEYAFNILGVDKVTIGVFENNEIAHACYKKVGFVDTEIVKHEPWNIIEMELLKSDYIEIKFKSRVLWPTTE